MIGIYRIINKFNGESYIGKSNNINRRINTHFDLLRRDQHRNRSGNRDKLQNAWNKYGESSFYWEVIEECSENLLDTREKYWISYYDSYKNGYNQTIGGEGGDTFTYRSNKDKITTRSKMSKSASNKLTITNGLDEKKVSYDNFINIYQSLGWYRGFSESHKRRLKENHKGFTGMTKTPEHNEKLRQRFKGIPLSDEHRKKLSDSHKGYVMPEEQKKRLIDSLKDRVRVTNGIIEKCIKRDELNSFLGINKDWHLGTKPRSKRKR